MDRLIGLVFLRWRLAARAASDGRARLVGLLLVLAGLAILSALGSVVAFAGVRLVERTQPQLTLALVSALSTALGVLWALSPLLAGVTLSETHDIERLFHFPIPLSVVVLSSLAANLAQPTVLSLMPPLVALGLAVSGPGWVLVPVLVGLALALALVVASGQLVAVALHALSRNRRLHDRALLAGIVLGLGLSLLPVVLMGGGAAPLARVTRELLARDVFALSPFAWGMRAAVHAGRGEADAFAAAAAAAGLAVCGVLALSTALVQRMYRGELNVGVAGEGDARARSRPLLPGPVGALIEKDLRLVWRDPRQKAVLLTSLVAPLVLLILVWLGSGGRVRPGLLLVLASLIGLSTVGSNALALERRGLALLFGFPVDRFLILVAKNLSALLLRAPVAVMVAAATALLASPRFVPAVLVVLWVTHLLSAAADNHLAALFPIPVPGPGRAPAVSSSGLHALVGVVTTVLAMAATLVLSLPFAFLAWLPDLMGEHRLWALTLPLGLGGAAAAYGMLTAAAAGLLARREPDLLARVLGEE